MVRYRHAQSRGANSYLTFTFTNFPTSAYAIEGKTIYVFAQIFDSYQCIISKNITASIVRTVEKCTKFNFGVISVSSLNGG